MKNWLAELNLICMVPSFPKSLYEAAGIYDTRRYCFSDMCIVCGVILR